MKPDMGFTLNIEISHELLDRILSYGDLTADDMDSEKISIIKAIMEQRFLERLEDEPHYAYDDYVEGYIK